MASTRATEPLETLDDDAFRQYQREGYLLVGDALPAETIDAARTRLREYTHGDREAPFQTMLEPAVEAGDAEVDEAGDAVRKYEGLDMVREDDVFRSLAEADGIVDPVADLLGPDLKLLRSAAMMKPPRVGSEKGLHQDAAYYPIQPRDHLTAWIPLDEATPENGCMQVVPGGHLEGPKEHVTQEYATDIVIPEEEYDEYVAVPMEPGDVLFTHCLTPHKTAPNTTDSPRRALIDSYMHARSRFTDPPEERPPYVDSVHVAGAEYPGCV
jgi:ectoine hydroxylase-related dioxygenase (phytanoyl-CoA dioxygenase family)